MRTHVCFALARQALITLAADALLMLIAFVVLRLAGQGTSMKRADKLDRGWYVILVAVYYGFWARVIAVDLFLVWYFNS